MSSSKKLIQASAGVGGGDFYPYTIDNSLFVGDGTKYLYHTGALASTPTDRKKLTISFWFKKSNFYSNTSQTDYFYLGMSTGYPTVQIADHYSSTDQLEITDYRPTPNPRYLMHSDTDMAFRDVSAWYHLVVVVDTTLSTATDRYRFYVNGSEITHTWRNQTSDTPQNVEFHYFNLAKYAIGAYINPNTAAYDPRGNGYYLAEYHAVDGTAYAPTDFGEFNNGVWIPKETSGISYGNGGFYLDFADSSDLGKDVSGNANHFSGSSITASDQMIDTPTNNFATWNPLKLRDTASAYWPLESYSEGNLTTTHTSSVAAGMSYTTVGVPDDTKMYCEIYVSTLGGSNIGIDSGLYANVPSAEDRYLYSSGGSISGPSSSTSGSSYTTGDIIGICIDRVSDEVAFYKNGSLQGTLSGLSDKPFFPFFLGDNNASIILNAGQNGTFNGNVTAGGNTDANDLGDFKYTVPTDALALCTANFPEPTIGPTSASLSDEHFDTVLYTGTGTSQSISTLEFQPDFVWIKSRTDAATHLLFDTIRGASNFLASSDSDAESTVTSTLTSFDTNGFTVGANNAANGSGDDIVAWNWKANGSGVSNTDGATASTVSVNTDAGFSIVTYTGTGSVTTVGHGLGVAPNFIIVKARDQGTGYNWCSYSSMLGPTYNTGGLDVTSAADAHPNYWANTAPTSSVFTVSTYGVVNDNGGQMLAYCFAEIEGFSSFGKYTGNGSADGPFIYTGFRPAWFMLKKSSGTGWWYVFDSERNTYNLTGKAVFPNSTSAESDYPGGSSLGMYFLSNGVKLRGSQTEQNGSGTTYIYMAFAENPFKYANAR